VVDVDRVVERLAVPLEDAHPAPGLAGGLKDDLLEEALVNEMRTGPDVRPAG
jgi:hypothetical protein